MYRTIALFAPILLFLLYACQPTGPGQEEEQVATADELPEITFHTSDSIEIFGDLHEHDKSASVVLLFHQAGANARSEYGTIIPRLLEEGYNVLAIDQRSGGQRFGGYNRTVAHIPKNRFEYCDAYPDLEGALDYLSQAGFTGKKIVWGSSYSAALVIQLASKRPTDVAAVLAFSPASGGPMADCNPNPYMETLKIPLLVLRPQREMEVESVIQQFNLAKKHQHQTHIAKTGVHGSSMLVESRTGSFVEDDWNVVLGFLEGIQ